MNLSKSSPLPNGSGWVNPRQYETRLFAALPRPVTGMPFALAIARASRATRK
jgi:hypothetical protein